MVKTLHPLGALSSRIEFSLESRVCVEHEIDPGRRPSFMPNADGESNEPAVISDVAAATQAALQSPLSFPPFAQSTVSGDQLAIAVDESVPSAMLVVRGAIDAAVKAGVEPDAISIVTTDVELAEALRAELSGTSDEAIRVEHHDPDDSDKLCPVGQMEGGSWLQINRTIFEADIVLPISCARLPGAGGNSIYDGLFPRFSDAETLGQFRAHRDSADHEAAGRRKADEAGWLLGASLVMQVVPGGDGSVASVVAGDPSAVGEFCQWSCRRLWSFRVARRASLVIATVTGDRFEQRWENVARALAATERVTEDGGAVAICSDLDIPPGPSLARLIGDWDWPKVERQAADDNSPDARTAWRLARALQNGTVYFLSQLDSDTVEQMGMAPVSNLDELARLAGRHESCIVLDDSQHAIATVASE